MKRLQPVEPPTVAFANTALGGEASQPATSMPEASTHGVSAKNGADAGVVVSLSSLPPHAVATPSTSTTASDPTARRGKAQP